MRWKIPIPIAPLHPQSECLGGHNHTRSEDSYHVNEIKSPFSMDAVRGVCNRDAHYLTTLHVTRSITTPCVPHQEAKEISFKHQNSYKFDMMNDLQSCLHVILMMGKYFTEKESRIEWMGAVRSKRADLTVARVLRIEDLLLIPNNQ